MSSRIYLDNAATSWPKPESVYSAVDQYQRRLGAAHGRGGYAEAAEVGRLVEAARRGAARVLGVADPARLAFTGSCTDALHLALAGLLRDGDRVVTTAVEHNSVLRPLRHLEDAGRIRVARVPCDGHGLVDPDDVRAALAQRARLVVVSQASNVTGAIQPVAEISRLAHEREALLLVDAAQTAGHLSVDVAALEVDLLAASAHKGLLAPLGLGLLYVRPGLERELIAVRSGGTGTRSEDDHQPDEMPAKFEAGNLNVPAIAGLGAAVEFIQGRSLAAIRAHAEGLTERLLAELRGIPGLTLYGPAGAAARVGLVSFNLAGYDPQEVAAMLDAASRVQVRAGLHCAPHLHRALGTSPRGGTVRISFGAFNTSEHVDRAADAIAGIAAGAAALG